MGLEAVMICIDNSEHSRNGDYAPSRFDAQSDTANIVGGIKTGQNPETGVGLLTMAGERCEVLITPTTSLDDFMKSLTDMRIQGKTDIVRGIQTATLALKHRQNKNQKQRVICFVGSPIENTDKQIEQLGKGLKKNNVSLDIISFGSEREVQEQNKAKLEKLIEVCNSNETSHYVEVPTGEGRNLSDVVLSSPVCFGEGGAPIPGGAGGDMGAGGAGANNFEFGIDPTADPELAMALRISMEEERRRQGPGEDDKPAEGGAAADGAAAAAPAPAVAAPGLDIEGFDDMDEELKQALLLSMGEQAAPAAPAAPAAGASSSSSAAAASGEPDAKKAKTDAPAAAAAGAAPVGDSNLFEDPDFVAGLLGSLPGVDLNDDKIKEAIGNAGGAKKDGDKKDGDKKDGDKKDGDKK